MTAISEALVPFGFTQLESEIYVFLLRESPATGYRIAQAIHKPAANTYKAIQTLQRKGAILVDGSGKQMVRAVPADELLARLEKEFAQRKSVTAKALKGLGRPTDDDRIYHLRSRDHIVGRTREMLNAAKTVALIKGPADFVQSIEAALEQAKERGVDVAVLTNSPLTVDSVEISVHDESIHGEVRAAVDAGQCLTGTLGEPAEAIWTKHPGYSQSAHGSLAAEITLAQVAQQLRDDEKKSRILRTLDSRRGLP